MDFDDLLVLWLRAMQDHEEIRHDLQRRFQFILVDEYQDTNKIQGDLIDLLAARHRNVMVVGDDSQSIYSWRGAHFLNILKFPERYPEAKIYRIETNYRSSPEILGVANAAIAANAQQFPKALAAARRSGDKPALVTCMDARVQAAFVAQRALELREEGVALDKMAVLYRSHFHALELQLEFTRRGIPFAITSGMRFFEQAHVKDIAAYLKLITNPRERACLQAHRPPLSRHRREGRRKTLACLPRNSSAARSHAFPPRHRPPKKSPPPSPKRPPSNGRNSPPPSPNWNPPTFARNQRA